MPTLPPEIMLLLLNFAPLLTPRTWQYVPILVAGSILLTPRRRMVSSALRVIGSSAGALVRQRASGAQPCGVVRASGQSGAVGAADRRFCAAQ